MSDLDQHSVELELRTHTPGVAAVRIERFGDRLVVVVRISGAIRRGALNPIDGENIAEAARMGARKRLPLVMFVSSSGANAAEGIEALHGWGQAARELTQCSGSVPIIAINDGPAVSGSALLIGLADIVIMTDDAYAFVSSPNGVRQFTGVNVGIEELGGSAIHGRSSGVAHAIVPDRAAAEAMVSQLLTFLPNNTDELPPVIESGDPTRRPTTEAADLLPDEPTGAYDVRAIVGEIVDDEYFLELRAGWAPNLVTGFASIGGHPVGIVANQPLAMAGTLDIAASQKGGRFVAFCDAFNIPLLTIIDTPGFYPGKDLEWRGMIRHGAQMAFAYARASVPRVALVLRKSYGGAYIVMDSKTMGNDVFLAWPTAEIAVMGARQAAEVIARRATPDEKEEFVLEYEDRYLNPYVAAERGYIDMVVEPADTRRVVAESLSMLRTKREELPERRHDNTPL
ncbi:MAG: methylmalonyl-CoA carboxyltransferase [Actinomycetia bacterium]|nr:methylmalonyl-CoA carboxyltransferase [Actinomycetes bacterium]MCP4962806.1 methylmalonyl-CoA carboxyltransferase [Actinomycetes bacterium]